MKIVVAAHGHCLDGLASAVVFTRLLREIHGAHTSFAYRACGYGPRQLRPTSDVLSGDENAILDYRYYPSEQLTWYFDHHRTSFQAQGDRESFQERVPSGRYFHDASYSSCSRLIRDRAKDTFGMEAPDLDPLVAWADVVDTAAFESPQEAVDRRHPVMRMVTVIENHGSTAFLNRFVPLLLTHPLEEVAASRELAEKYKPLGKKHEAFLKRLEAQSRAIGRVVYCDLTAEPVETIGKFASYALYPTSTYSVLVAQLGSAVKICVGYNPWGGKPLDTDISAICARHGGGGHPVVGGINFELSERERARQVAQEIAEELAAVDSP